MSILLSAHADKRMRTVSGTAVASDIYSGKKAVVNGIPITGTATDKKPLSNGNGILLFMRNPVGVEDAAFHPTSEHGAIIVKQSGVTPLAHNNWILRSNGDARNALTFQHYARVVSPPAYTLMRVYEVWGRIFDNTIPDDAGIAIYSNYIDGSNYWYSVLRRATSWGGFYTQIREVTAGVNTVRADDGGYSSSLDMPATFHCKLTEQGDSLMWQTQLWQDSGATHGTFANFYTIANRAHKSSLEFRITNASGGGDNVQIQGCRVMDLL